MGILAGKPLDLYSSDYQWLKTIQEVTDGDPNTRVIISSRLILIAFTNPVPIERVLLNTSNYHRYFTIDFYKESDFTDLIVTYQHSYENNGDFVPFPVEHVQSLILRYDSNNGNSFYEFDLESKESDVDLLVTRYLLQKEGKIYNWRSNHWYEIAEGEPTEELFLTKGMPMFPETAKDEPLEGSTIVAYSNVSEKTFQLEATTYSIYDDNTKSYKGISVVETEIEILSEGRKVLFINANHKNCSFQYSLDKGETWYNTDIEEVIDITTIKGNELKIRVSLPSTSSELTALSYAWA